MSSPNHDAVLLGGRLITVTLLRVQDSSPPVIAAALDAHLRTAASLAALPTVLDLEALGPTLGGLDLPQLVELLRAREAGHRGQGGWRLRAFCDWLASCSPARATVWPRHCARSDDPTPVTLPPAYEGFWRSTTEVPSDHRV